MRKIVLLSLSIFFSLFSFSQNNQPATIRELTDAIRAQMKQQHITGLMLGITTKDSVIFNGGLGYADVSANRPVDSSTLFRMGSITKMFVSLSILQLVKEGKLRLTDEVKKIAPEIPISNAWEKESPVRVINLLEHTSGFDDIKLNNMYVLGTAQQNGLERVLAQQHSLICRWRPGERFAYSNPNYAILGYLVEKFSGKPFDQYISGLIFQPLGMSHSNFNTYSKLPAQETAEYYFQHGKAMKAPSVNLLNGCAGALWSSSDDMLKFIQMFLNNGAPVFSDSLLTVMETPQSSLAAKAGLKTGYALANITTSANARFSYHGHDGLIGTCFSTCNYNREKGIGFIIATNSNINPGAIRRLVEEYIEQHIPLKGTIEQLVTYPLNVPEITPWLGRYQFESPRFTISAFKDKLMDAPQFFVQDGKLFFKPLMSDAYELVQTAPLTFAWKGNNAPLFVFTKNAEGEQVMALGGTYYEKVSNTAAVGKRIGIAIMVLFGLLTYLLSIVTIFGLLFKKINWKDGIIRIVPAIGVTLVIIAVVKMLEVQNYSFKLYELGSVNSRTLTVFLGTSIFGIIVLITLYFSIKNYRKTKQRWFANYFLLTGLSLFIIALLLWQAGWIGLRTWAM
jgi:CubicO group peptidase (beta-lactamase class C family)